MNYFEFLDMGREADGRKVLRVNILREKSCTFNCVICPLKKAHFGEATTFGEIQDSLAVLEQKLEQEKPDLVDLRGNGEPMTNDQIVKVIDFVHSKGLPVRLYTNGYLLGIMPHMRIASMCEEVLGCLSFTEEESFRRIHRPLSGYSCRAHLDHMAKFSHQYKGKFILKITILKGYNDSEEQIQNLKNEIEKIHPTVVDVVTINYGKAEKIMAVAKERLAEIKEILEN